MRKNWHEEECWWGHRYWFCCNFYKATIVYTNGKYNCFIWSDGECVLKFSKNTLADAQEKCEFAIFALGNE